MKKVALLLFPLSLVILSACARQPDQVPTKATPTPDPDPCSSQNLPATVEDINNLMRAFDDASQQISDGSSQQLPGMISNLQRIRRDAEDLQIPPCLATLKTHQLNHMNLTINALIAFVGGADQQTLNSGLGTAHREHELYSLELVRLLGITLAPITATPP